MPSKDYTFKALSGGQGILATAHWAEKQIEYDNAIGEKIRICASISLVLTIDSNCIPWRWIYHWVEGYDSSSSD